MLLPLGWLAWLINILIPFRNGITFRWAVYGIGKTDAWQLTISDDIFVRNIVSLTGLTVVSDIDSPSWLDFPKVLCPVRCGGGFRGRVRQWLVEKVGKRMIIFRKENILSWTWSQPRYRLTCPGVSMSILDAMSFQPFDIDSMGPAILKSSTYTTNRSLSSGWKNTDGQPSGSGIMNPTAWSIASQWRSQRPPESGCPYNAILNNTTGLTNLPTQSFRPTITGYFNPSLNPLHQCLSICLYLIILFSCMARLRSVCIDSFTCFHSSRWWP